MSLVLAVIAQDQSYDPGAWWGWIAAGAVVIGGILAALQLSIRDASRSRMDALLSRPGKEKVAARVERILDDASGHASAVGLPRIVANLVAAVTIVEWVAYVRGGGAPGWVEVTLGLGLATLAIWLLGMVLPMSIARYAPEPTVVAWSRVIRAMHGLLWPARMVARFTDEVVRRLAGTEEPGAGAREAELISVVEEGAREGEFDQSELDMIHAVVALRSATVAQVMTPRTDMEALELTTDLREVISFLRESKHSRVPVYEGTLDQIVGVFYIKDLMLWLAGDGARGAGRQFDLRSILRPALFVPETKTVRELLADLLAKRVHIALVADEYGGIAGLVTIEDIVEEVFGDIQDEYERPEDEIPGVVVESGSGRAEVDARMRIGDANEGLAPLAVELPEGEEYDTVGGFILTTLGRIPRAGESFQHGSATITVTAAEAARVLRARIDVGTPGGEDVRSALPGADPVTSG